MKTNEQILQEIINHNEKQLDLVEGDQGAAEDLFTFEFEGISIYNPIYDETLRFEVNPAEYYGEDNIAGLIKRYKERTIE